MYFPPFQVSSLQPRAAKLSKCNSRCSEKEQTSYSRGARGAPCQCERDLQPCGALVCARLGGLGGLFAFHFVPCGTSTVVLTFRCVPSHGRRAHTEARTRVVLAVSRGSALKEVGSHRHRRRYRIGVHRPHRNDHPKVSGSETKAGPYGSSSCVLISVRDVA